jgi:hypothetical protein
VQQGIKHSLSPIAWALFPLLLVLTTSWEDSAFLNSTPLPCWGFSVYLKTTGILFA